MGILSDCMEANCRGVLIEVEAKLCINDNWKNGVTQYRLIIDNKVAQEETGHIGRTTLRGFINRQAGTKDNVKVIINQGLFRTNYILEVNGQKYNLVKKY